MKRAIIAVVLALGCGRESRTEQMFGSSKIDIAKLTVMKFAVEAFPQWTREHPDKSCPSELDELVEYMASKSTLDPWDNRYQLLCPPNLPAGARGIAIVSFGEDGKEGTGDDIKSWE